jgi:PIN domain nuclease of toxin-antitoxin system
MIVLDTHALIWWVSNDDALSAAAREAIDRELDGGTIIVSTVSAGEVAMLVKQGRLGLSMELGSWLDTIARIEAVKFCPVDTEIAVKSVDLPGEFHKDPADRMIVATARKFAAPLVTKDDKILAYPHVRSIW